MYFRNYRLPNTWLDTCLKIPNPEHCSTVNMVKGPKYCLSLNNGTFINFFHHSGGSCVGKYRSY